MTRQLLTFPKGGEPIKKTISILELIRDTTDFALSGSNIRSEFDMQEDLWLVEVGKGQLNQVFNNLIINSVQAMPGGVVIKVRAENINIRTKCDCSLEGKNHIRIIVKDQGRGIQQEHLQKIFDPYFTTKENGSGLGLAITYSIIKKHDGHITVESKEKVWTMFYIVLPASQKEISENPVRSEVKAAYPEPIKGENVE